MSALPPSIQPLTAQIKTVIPDNKYGELLELIDLQRGRLRTQFHSAQIQLSNNDSHKDQHQRANKPEPSVPTINCDLTIEVGALRHPEPGPIDTRIKIFDRAVSAFESELQKSGFDPQRINPLER